MSAIETTLKSVPLFATMSPGSISRLRRSARLRAYRSGDVLLEEGSEGVGFFVLVSGAVEVRQHGDLLAILGAGDFFGEMALLGVNHRRSAEVIATGPVTALVIPRSDFLAELRGDRSLMMRMLAVMARRLRETDRRVAELTSPGPGFSVT